MAFLGKVRFDRATTRGIGSLFVALTMACGGPPPVSREPVVVVSVLPQAWLVERLAGDRVEIVVMIPPGASPATFEPELDQLRALAEASLYVKVGHPHFPFEAAWLDRLLADQPELPVVDLAGGRSSVAQDPHVWLSPRRVDVMIDPLAEALARVVPEEHDAILERAAALHAEVATIDARLGRILAPARGRSFLTVHAAWGYLAEDYQLVQLAIEHENKEPDPHRVAALIEQARALGIDVVFAQPQFDPRSALLLAEAIGGRVEWIDPLARDWPVNLVRVAELLAQAARG